MSYSLEFSESAIGALEDLGHADSKRLRQVFLKILSLRRTPRPADSEQLANFSYKGLSGFRDTQGEYRIVYAIDVKAKLVKLARVLHRDRDYRELDRI
ncbi:MAG: type II toxin-antitoxin system RelE/ParE family toxin [Nitrospirae bacterium]|nr:type II toxin-antitoxin system RelE/ParE family toxin [Nitrospirota bacterium]